MTSSFVRGESLVRGVRSYSDASASPPDPPRSGFVQLAVSLGLDVKTVRHWIGRPYAPRQAVRRSSKLDPFKGRIVGWLDAHPLSAQQVFQRLCDNGYGGGISIVKDYVRAIRPRPREAFLTLAFAPGEAAQVDWGLCRARHRPHYAESRTMPSRSRMPLHPLHSTTLSPF
jgi:transposase